MRAEAGFSRHLNFRLFQQYLRTPAVPGGGFERPNPLIAGGPNPNAVI